MDRGSKTPSLVDGSAVDGSSVDGHAVDGSSMDRRAVDGSSVEKERAQKKLQALRHFFSQFDSCLVAFSGGVDSALLLTVASQELGEGCVAITATSPLHPKREMEGALTFVKERKIRHILLEDELSSEIFDNNPKDRCYHCKKAMLQRLLQIAEDEKIDVIVEGSNLSDESAYRPGKKAVIELGVRSPLCEVGLLKSEIRFLAQDVFHLAEGKKPSMPCLATRFPYGAPITKKQLNQVEKVEDYLLKESYRNFRGRHHGDILRLEVETKEFTRFMRETRKDFLDFAKNLGFKYVTLDLSGYRSGSMDE